MDKIFLDLIYIDTHMVVTVEEYRLGRLIHHSVHGRNKCQCGYQYNISSADAKVPQTQMQFAYCAVR